MRRFFVPPGDGTGDRVVLPEAEAHHALRVLRLARGDAVEILDGCGGVASGVLEEAERRRAVVRITERHVVAPPPVRLRLLAALVKGERFDWLLQKATELGVWQIVPLTAARCVVRVKPQAAAARVEKWRHTCIEAAKQCGTPFVPDVAAPVPPAECFGGIAARPGLKLLGALTPDRVPLREAVTSGAGAGDVWLAIGPEGDFAPEEVVAARQAGFAVVALGALTLRSETAALYGASVLAWHFLGGPGGEEAR